MTTDPGLLVLSALIVGAFAAACKLHDHIKDRKGVK